MNKLRTLVYTVLEGVENRVDNFLVRVEHVFSSTVNELVEIGRQAAQQGIGVVFGLIEMVIAESFGLVGAVVELVIGKRDLLSFPNELGGVTRSYGVFEPGDPAVFGLNDDGEIIKEDN